MAGLITTRNIAYNQQTVQIRFWPNGVPDDGGVVYTVVGPFNAPVVEAADNGAFYAVYGDLNTGIGTVLFWSNINQSLTPVVVNQRLDLGGKWCAFFDESRRELLIIGQSGKMHIFSETLTYLGAGEPLANNTAGYCQYTVIDRCSDGRIHLMLTSSDVGASPVASYLAIGVMWSPDKRAWTGWRTPRLNWPGAPWFGRPMPVDGNEASVFITRGEELYWNKMLSGQLVDEDYYHLFHMVTPKRAGKFLENGGLRTSCVYHRLDRRTGNYSRLRWPAQITGFRPVMPGSILTRRGTTLWHLLLDRVDIVVTRSTDNGDSWDVVERIPIPQFENGGTMLHYLTARRGFWNDDHIEMMVTAVNATWDEWSAGGVAIDLSPSRVFHVRLEIDS